MLTIENAAITLSAAPDGSSFILVDRSRKAVWRLDPARRHFHPRQADGFAGCPQPLPAGRVERLGDELVLTHAVGSGTVRTFWSLGPDHVRVRLAVEGDGIGAVDLPGVFRPAAGRPQLLLPLYQGVLYRGGDDPWEETRGSGAHGRLSLSMAAALAPTGALLATAEDLADWQCRIGEDADGPYFTFRADRCPVDGWYTREVRLYPVDADITAIAKRYRARLRERNEFVGWDEKIARKPILENLFGGLMAFIGYNKAPDVDYVGYARRLHDAGFERVLYYPVRMCNYSLDFQMGGDAPIWLTDDELARMHAVPGALLAPWGWFIEGLDDGSGRMARLYRRDAAGNPYNGWRIEKQQWKLVCIPYQVEESRRRYASDMGAMDWIHYDVNATQLGREPCFAPAHDLHGGRPLGRRGDADWTRRLLGPDTNGNRIVSSEGFLDRYAVSYDIGSTKLIPAWGHSLFIPVPLTMLALHDSCVHDWWEVHNYNLIPGMPPMPQRIGQAGSGLARKKAAMDALYGCPPNVFPFGRQYAWTDVATRRTFSFTVHLDDAEVQGALAAALPVTRLHRRIGKQELVSFRFLSPDYALQETIFADGTRVVANIGDRPRAADRIDPVAPDAWLEAR